MTASKRFVEVASSAFKKNDYSSARISRFRSVFSRRMYGIVLAICALPLSTRAGEIYVASVNGFGAGAGTVAKFSTSGTTISNPLVSALDSPWAVAVSGADLYVANDNTGVVGKYTTSGGIQNASFITGAGGPTGLAVNGTHLYVSDSISNTIKDYSTSGTLLNGSFITSVNGPWQVTVSGSFIYVANMGNGTVGKYTTAGVPVNTSLISGLNEVTGVAASADGSQLFVATQGDGKIGEYDATSGAAINATLITQLTPESLVVVGTNLYAANFQGFVAQYTTSGAVVDTQLISGLNGPIGLAVVPEPTACTALFAVASTLALRRRRNNS